MRSVIFSVMARVLCVVLAFVSIAILLRGHNQPGGGFVGGLVAAMSIGLIALADGVGVARTWLRVHPVALAGVGVLLGILGGLPGLFRAGSFLQHQWVELGQLKLGTTMIFDLGVYLAVFGGTLALIFRLYEDDA